MADLAIRVEGLGKRYRIGSSRPRYPTLRESLASAGRSLARRIRAGAPRSAGGDAGHIWALRDVSFAVERGEVTGIIGRNGAGKSTLLKILSRVTEPTAGRAELCGRVSSLLEVGTGFHVELTGRENIYLNGAILGMGRREIDRKFDAIVDFAGFPSFIDTPVKHYSSGMQVRLAFAVAAHLEPDILLVDEVLAVGDAEFQRKCMDKMRTVTREGRTILFVSHNMAAIRTLCGRALWLQEGRIARDGSTEEVVAAYLHGNRAATPVVRGDEIEAHLEARVDHVAPSIRCLEVALLDGGGRPAAAFRSDEEILLRMTYECLRPVRNLVVTVFLVDEENRRILATQSLDDPGSQAFYDMDPGVYQSVCRIPANLFGEQRLYASMYLRIPKMESFVLERVLAFDVSFVGYSGGLDHGLGRKAVLRPRLGWATAMVTPERLPGVRG